MTSIDASTGSISVERRNHVAIVWLDRPDKLNAMAPDFWEGFPAAIERLGSDDDVRVVVVAGRGRAFSVGIDLAAFGPAFASGSIPGADGVAGSDVAQRRALYRQVKRMQHTFNALAECPKPTIAAIHGYCLGAGVDLITACDIRLCADDAVFSVRETRLAMVADVGTLQRLPRIVDPGTVAELVYTGRDFTAQEACDMGLVRRVLPDADAVLDAALTMAEEIAANSPLAVQGAKAVLRNTDGRSLGEQLDYMALWSAAFLMSDDLGEALRAVVEGRDPDFTGG
jgi:enoyl-CoA hydratase